MSTKIKVMTFNLRVVAEVDGVNIFYNRKSRILETIKMEAPELIGFQEANDEMRNWLREAIAPEYTLVGCGRNANYFGESTVLAFKNSSFNMIKSDNFWLSATPEIPGSRYEDIDQSHCPRMCTVALLKHKDAAGLLWFYNTHTDHKGSHARLVEAKQVMEHIQTHVDYKGGQRFVLTGDMNAYPDAPEILEFTDFIKDRKVTDLTENVGGTFHGFGKRETPVKIDYIFTDADCDINESYKIDEGAKYGIYISDHVPVCGYITLE